jgi:hypothetical protein
MKSASLARSAGIVAVVALLLAGLVFIYLPKVPSQQQLAQPVPSSSTVNLATGAQATALVDTGNSASATRARFVGITNFAALTPAQARQFRTVVAPGVSNFITLLRQRGTSRFDPQPIGPENFSRCTNPSREASGI